MGTVKADNQSDRRTTHLNVRLLLQLVLLWRSAVCQEPVPTILFHQILDDGTGFPQHNAGIWTFDCWKATNGIYGDEVRAFGVIERDMARLASGKSSTVRRCAFAAKIFFK